MSADESFAYDPEGTVGIPGLSEIVIKPMFLGGVAQAFHWARRIRDTGLGVCITHAFESNVGRMGALHLSAALNDGGTHGVSTARPENPSWADVPTAAGIGVSI